MCVEEAHLGLALEKQAGCQQRLMLMWEEEVKVFQAAEQQKQEGQCPITRAKGQEERQSQENKTRTD